MLILSEDSDTMRPFPWKCGTCGRREVKPVVVDYATDREHDGRAYPLEIPDLEILECAACRARQLTDEAREKLEDALREKAGLLKPKEIRANRTGLGLTQEQLANSLRVAKETVSRWETGGQIQQRAMDLLLRVFFAFPPVRAMLTDESQSLEIGTAVIQSQTYGGAFWSFTAGMAKGCITGTVMGVAGGGEQILPEFDFRRPAPSARIPSVIFERLNPD